MALFIDTDIRMIPELARYESSIIDVANTEGIDLAAKLDVAKSEIGLELERFFASLISYDPALFWRPTLLSKLTMGNVVFSDALKQWQVCRTIAVTYRDAYHRQLNSRYQAQYAEFTRLAENAQSNCLDLGVGIVFNPIPAASPPVATVPGGPVTAGGWFLSASWTGANGAEGAPGPTAQYAAPTGIAMAVTSGNPPSNVTGWNIYAGQTESTMGLQNDVPISVGSAWNLPANGFRTGRVPGTGQRHDQLLQRRRILRRG